MRLKIILALWLGSTFLAGCVRAQTNAAKPEPASPRPLLAVQTTNFLGLITNGPAVLQTFQITQTWTNSYFSRNPVVATNPTFVKMRQSSYTWTNAVFAGFAPDSLSHVIWTNFLAQTNGRDLRLWSTRRHSEGWPTNPPVVIWNTNNVLWGMAGMTALSPCWQGEGNQGQIPLTALTRRHAYTRGHSMGPDGFHTGHAGFKAWFVTANNSVVEVKIRRTVVRASTGANGLRRDYTIVLFDRDLPESIEPMSVATVAEVQSKYPASGPVNSPHPIFQTEQAGYVSTGISPLVINTWKGGDSGSPDMVPLPAELVFYHGRSTTGPSREMQEDMDELCRLEKLNPKDYQLHWVDLSNYPSY